MEKLRPRGHYFVSPKCINNLHKNFFVNIDVYSNLCSAHVLHLYYMLYFERFAVLQ